MYPIRERGGEREREREREVEKSRAVMRCPGPHSHGGHRRRRQAAGDDLGWHTGRKREIKRGGK